MVLAVRVAFPSNPKDFRNAHVICIRHRHDDFRSRLPDLAQADERAPSHSQPVTVTAALINMEKNSSPKRGYHLRSRLTKPARDRTGQPSSEDDAIDAAIKRSIDEFGA